MATKKTRPQTTELNRSIKNQNWSLARAECHHNPYLASIWSVQSNFLNGKCVSIVLPIHQACSLRPPDWFVQTLVTSCPSSVKAKEASFGRLPLHVACRAGASESVVKILLGNFPQGAISRDKLGRTALHYALSNVSDVNVVRILLEASEESARVSDLKGWLPIHVACCCDSPLEVISLLLDAFPLSVLSRTKKGSTPLMCAQLFGKNADDVQQLQYEAFWKEKALNILK